MIHVSSKGQTNVFLAPTSKQNGPHLGSLPEGQGVRLPQDFPELAPDRSRGQVLKTEARANVLQEGGRLGPGGFGCTKVVQQMSLGK